MVQLHHASSLTLANYAILRRMSQLLGPEIIGLSTACYVEREPIAERIQNAALDPKAYWTLHT
jgi:hypothetical protein